MMSNRARSITSRIIAAFVVSIFAVGCVGKPPVRLGMVENRETGLQFGSVVDGTLLTDASFYRNKKIKLRTRNTSGDVAFDLDNLEGQLTRAYAAKGYEPTADDDFGLMLDVNVKYSGQIQESLALDYGLLGAAGGGIAGAAHGGGVATAAGVLTGATFGSIVGSYVTDDTYIIIARVTFAQVKEPRKKASKTITFSRSFKPDEDEEDRIRKEERRSARSFKKAHPVDVAVFAGGRNAPQAKIAEEVRQRLIRIVGDII